MSVQKRINRINCLLISLLMLLTCIFGNYVINALALTDYEIYLQGQGFPESYWNNLKTLHEMHPKWIFNAQKINLNWDDVVTAESAVAKNLVAKSSIDSWKSFEYGAYNFTAKDWVGFDGSSWVAAAKEITTYYLDPRNFANDSTIFMFLQQSYDASAQTVDGILKMVKSTFLDCAFPEQGYSTYSDVILEAAKQSGVNPYVLASLIIQEQGITGSSGSISGIYPGYEGYYNYFNIGAYASGSMTAVERGLWYAAGSGAGATTNNRPWNTRAKSIINGAIYYGKNYVNVGQNNLYYKKFNVVNQSAGYYNHQYMTNIQGAESEAKSLKKAYVNVIDTELIFNIPVYNNMPDTPAVKPTSTGNNNNLLTSLGVDEYTLTPSFTMYTTGYDLIVDKSTYSIQVQAFTSDSKATIKSPLTVSLADGNNIVPVVVCAPSGVIRTYTLNIFKPVNLELPSVTSTSYTMTSFISNVLPDTSVNDFIAKFTVSNASLNVINSSGNTKSGTVATGDKLQIIQNNSVYAAYEISVNGDINGDGTITSFDLLKIQKHILNISPLSNVSLSSADINKDGNVTSFDMLKGQKYILKL